MPMDIAGAVAPMSESEPGVPSETSPDHALALTGRQFQEMKAAGIVAENRFPLVTTGSDMVPASGPLDAQWP